MAKKSKRVKIKVIADPNCPADQLFVIPGNFMATSISATSGSLSIQTLQAAYNYITLNDSSEFQMTNIRIGQKYRGIQKVFYSGDQEFNWKEIELFRWEI